MCRTGRCCRRSAASSGRCCRRASRRSRDWRTRLGAALGANGGVLAEVIPEIEFVLGEQPPPAAIDPADAQNRFRFVFQSFVAALARRQHPLVVFLDDLQWADAATLDLLHALLTGPGLRHVLFIGAYRDNEIDERHLLTLRARSARQRGRAASGDCRSARCSSPTSSRSCARRCTARPPTSSRWPP